MGSVRTAPATRRRTRWWVETLAIVWLLWVYDAISNLAPLRLNAAIGHAWGVLHLEQALHLDPELALDRWLSGHHTLALLLSDYYDNAHFAVTLPLLGWLWWRRTDLYRPLRNSLLLVNALAFVVFWRYPVAPPRMLSSRGFTDVVASTHAFGSWHTGALASHANQLAAMPSLHMAWAAWCGLVLWKLSERRVARALAILYPCLTAFAVLATGNHFVLDIAGGLVAMAVAVSIVRVVSLSRASARTRGGEQMPAIATTAAERMGRERAAAERADAERAGAETTQAGKTRRRRTRAPGARILVARRLWPAKPTKTFPIQTFPAKSSGLAYRMSQTCYEVPDQVD